MSDVNFRELNLMVIDDEQFMRQLIHRLLLEMGVGFIVPANDGEQALELLAQADPYPDLIICDLEMPKMDGFEFVERLRNQTHMGNPNVPVLIVTGHSDPDSIHSAIDKGINGFVVKPVSHDTLKKRMLHALKAPTIAPDRVKEEPAPPDGQ